jgi:cytochrome c biogenesis protein CcmG/thiol:disulfide interchange protein DsbE
MANNHELTADPWVDERLARLSHDREWRPNTTKGLARLRERRRHRVERGQGWLWAAAVATAAGICLMAFPAPRVLAHYCLDCSVALWQSLSNSSSAGAPAKLETDRKTAPDFALNDASGKPVRLSALQGKVVLLNFWATWCGGCQVEIPWFIQFESKYKNSGLAIIGVSMDDDGWKSVKPYIEQKKVNYTIVIGNDELGKLYGLGSMPMTLLIDRDGKIAASHVGLVRRRDYQNEIETLLNGKAAAAISAPKG